MAADNIPDGEEGFGGRSQSSSWNIVVCARTPFLLTKMKFVT